MPPTPAPAKAPRRSKASAAQNGPTVECWDCGAANPPIRSVCQECGTWIKVRSAGEPPVAIGMNLRAQPAAAYSGALPGSVAVAAPLGHYSTGQRQLPVFFGRRALAATAAIFMAGLVMATAWSIGTSPSSQGGGQPALAAATIAEATPLAPAAVPEPSAVAAEATTDSAVAPAAAATPGAKPTPTVEPTREPTPKPTAKPALTVMASPTATPRPTATSTTKAESEVADAGSRSGPRTPAAERAPQRVNGWVCDGAVRAEDVGGRSWSVSHVSFRPGNGYERVILRLKRIGRDTGAPASVTAEAFPSSKVRAHVRGAARPKAGETTLSLHLADGIRGTLGLRGYRPRGLNTLKEFSAYRTGANSSKLLISVAGNGCFRLRAPALRGAASNTGTGQVWLDIKS